MTAGTRMDWVSEVGRVGARNSLRDEGARAKLSDVMGAFVRIHAGLVQTLASDECTRQVLTCLPGGDTALDNVTFATAVNCMLGGVAPQLREKVGKPIAVPKRSGEMGELRKDAGLGMPLDALGTNLLAAEVGGRSGGFERRHDKFRDAIMKEARKARYSVLREFAFGTEHGMAAAHATLLRGAAAVLPRRRGGVRREQPRSRRRGAPASPPGHGVIGEEEGVTDIILDTRTRKLVSDLFVAHMKDQPSL